MFNFILNSNLLNIISRILTQTKKNIFYWSPNLVNIATNFAVINSIFSLTRYSKSYECYLLNFFGEFNRFHEELSQKKIKVINYFNNKLFNFLPKYGKISSRFSFIIIFIFSYFPLKNILNKKKPDYLIIHLITSLPLILLIFNNFKTNFILRISGYPKMNFLRKILWKIALKKIYMVTCPTLNTLNYIKSLNIVDSKKIKLLYDPIINVSEINRKKKGRINFKNFYLSVGRLTKQKNFLFLCRVFNEIVKKNRQVKLLIAGSGEEKHKIKKFIKENKLENNIILLGHVENIFPYFVKSNGFILTSLWEDPGFVLLEAAYCRAPVLSCDAWPGPVELIKDNFNGVIFENNNIISLLNKFHYLENFNKIQELKINNLKLCRKFTLFSHYKSISKLL